VRLFVRAHCKAVREYLLPGLLGKKNKEFEMGYMLYVDDKPTIMGTSYKEAKKAANTNSIIPLPLRIESFVAPMPSQIWIYDYTIQEWIEQK